MVQILILYDTIFLSILSLLYLYIYVEVVSSMFAAIIDKLGNEIIPERKANPKLDDDDDEEKKWRGYVVFSNMKIWYIDFQDPSAFQ